MIMSLFWTEKEQQSERSKKYVYIFMDFVDVSKGGRKNEKGN